ncbi:MAG: DUF4258 domain-containing protein [Burkholderiales bacterium]
MGYANFGAKTSLQLQRHIRTISANTSSIVITIHASARMKDRRVSRGEVFECLRHGVIRKIPEPDLAKGSLTCRMEHYIAGRDCAVVVALADETPDVIVVTVMIV